MSAELLASDLKSRLQLRTKTVGAEKIQKAKDNNEDVAILSMFLPGSVGEAENKRFKCHLMTDCYHGDHRKAIPGKTIFTSVLQFVLYNTRMYKQNIAKFFKFHFTTHKHIDCKHFSKNLPLFHLQDSF